MRLCGFDVGPSSPFFLIAGPCVIESEGLTLDIANELKSIGRELNIPVILKRLMTRLIVRLETLIAAWVWQQDLKYCQKSKI